MRIVCDVMVWIGGSRNTSLGLPYPPWSARSRTSNPRRCASIAGTNRFVTGLPQTEDYAGAHPGGQLEWVTS
jgi:hypothetical protein